MLLADLDQMIGRMQMSGPDLDCWADASRTFDVWLKKLACRKGTNPRRSERYRKSRERGSMVVIRSERSSMRSTSTWMIWS